jgi:hypothetical protein
MAYIPHPQVPLGHLRPNDIFFLLALGAVWELVLRVFLIRYKAKPMKLLQKEHGLKALQTRVTQSRNKGPSAFVETSKLERQLLADEKSLAETTELRKAKLAGIEKYTKVAMYVVSGLVYLLWYGVPILEFAGHRVETVEVLSAEEGQELAISAFNAFLFPLSYVGVGLKLSKWGLLNPKASSGALLAFWSAQTTVSKIMDAVDALVV